MKQTKLRFRDCLSGLALVPPLHLLGLLMLFVAAFAHAQNYYLPPGVSNIRAMVIGGPPLSAGTSQIWRDFALAQRVGYAQLLTDLPNIASTSGHPEIANAAFVSVGNSAGASAAAALAIGNQNRAIAVVALHGVMFAQGNSGFNANRSGENGDVPTLDFSGAYGIPMLHNFDNNDGFVSPVVLQGLLEFGRARGALWAFFIHNDGNHGDSNTALTTLIFPWLANILDQRLPASAGTGTASPSLNALLESSGWLGDIKTKAIANFASFSGDKAKAAWFPNQSIASVWAGYHFIPPYNIPAQPVLAPSGIIADLTIFDPLNNDISSGTGWKINANLKEADQAGSLIKVFVMAPPPASVAGLDWIRPIVAGKNYFAYTSDPIFSFRTTADASVYIAHPDSITPRPSWLASWTNTGEQMVITAGNLNANAPRYTLFKKDFAANAVVVCGGTGSATSSSMYLTMVKPLGVITLASVAISASDASATEGGDTGEFSISRTGDVSAALSVTFNVSGSAGSGSDYTAFGTSVSIPAGQSNTTIAVAAINDIELESTELVTVTLASSANYNLGAPTVASVSILDDDAPALAVVSVSDTISSAAEPATPGQFTITRTGATSAALDVFFNVTGAAQAGVDYTALGTQITIPMGQASVDIAVSPIDDLLVELSESVTLSLSAHASYSLGNISVASVNILDNDSVAGAATVTLTSTDSLAAESSGVANIGNLTITRSGASTDALSVNLVFSGAAANGVDITTVASAISIPAGQAAIALSIAPIDDSLVEGSETFAARIAPSASYIVGGSGIGILINDNDNATPTVSTGIVFASRNVAGNVRETKLNVYRPSVGTGPWPVVIYYPGGGWTSQNEGSISALFTNLTAHGYAVVSANYVSSSFAKWPAQIQDAKAAVRWVRANAAAYGFDASRIAVTGTSSGGHMAAYVGACSGRSSARIGAETIDLVGAASGNLTQSDVVQAAAPFYPPTDLLVMDHYPTPDVPDHNASTSPESMLIGFPIQTVPEKTATANPLIFARPNPQIPRLPPFWITHGTMDRSVDFNQSERFNAALIGSGQTATFWPVLGAGHGSGVIDSQEVHSLLKGFLDRTLLGITSNALPVAQFSASATAGMAPLSVNFDGAGATDSDGIITKYSWSSGDNSGVGSGVGGSINFSVNYTRPGIYPVTLAVRDDAGGTSSRTINITVSAAGTSGATPPSAVLAGPVPGAVYSPTGDLLLESTVTATPGTPISSVEFFLSGPGINNQIIAWDSKLPYNTTLGGLPPGLYSASVRVSDVLGGATTSPAVAFRVNGCDLFCSGFEE